MARAAGVLPGKEADQPVCGIAGIFVPPGGAPVDRRQLEAMTQRLVHRGPDDHGIHVEPGVGLGFRRLSIIDLAGGHQPLFNEDGTVAVIFNGEIYNFHDLRSRLRAEGHRFATAADTEVLVHGWESWGAGLVGELRGMFAFAIWDRRRHVLFLARDRLGIKPLYYSRLRDGSWIFGSEMKALLVAPGLDRRVDPQAVEDYFALGYIPEPRSIFSSVRKLPPAHTLTLGNGDEPSPAAYWDVRFASADRFADDEEALEPLLEQMDDAVRSHLVADVPVGAFLSGGIDSSAVVASMAAAVDGPVQTCTVAFAEESHDESPYARLVADEFGTDHHEETAEAGDFRLLDRIVEAFDEPFSDNSSLPTYLLCSLARKRVKVALSGDGGDETCAGYRRYNRFVEAMQWRGAIPTPLRGPVLTAASAVISRLGSPAVGARRAAALRSLAGEPMEAYLRLVGLSDASEREALFSGALRRDLQGYRTVDLLRGHLGRAQADDPLSLAQYVDIKTYLPGEILTKVDRASMAHSLEVRVPLLDHHWVEWTAAIAPERRMRRGAGKHLLREALRRRLPGAILDRPKKGFSFPVAAWLRGPLREAMTRRLRGAEVGKSGLLDPASVDRLVQEHLDESRDHAALLWALLIFQAAWERLAGD